MSYEAFCREAVEIGALCRAHHVPFVINDNVEVALAAGADGVHVGQHDRAACDVRRLIGPDKILGVSAQTVAQARLAEAQGADYLGVGSVFPTSTKLDADAVSPETLCEICRAVSIPVVAIGGITDVYKRQGVYGGKLPPLVRDRHADAPFGDEPHDIPQKRRLAKPRRGDNQGVQHPAVCKKRV